MRKASYQEWLKPANLAKLEELASHMLDYELAEALGINPKTLGTWKRLYPSIRNAVNRGGDKRRANRTQVRRRKVQCSDRERWLSDKGIAEIAKLAAESEFRKDIAEKMGVKITKLRYWAEIDDRVQKALGRHKIYVHDPQAKKAKDAKLKAELEARQRRAAVAKCERCSGRRGRKVCFMPDGLCEVFKR